MAIAFVELCHCQDKRVKTGGTEGRKVSMTISPCLPSVKPPRRAWLVTLITASEGGSLHVDSGRDGSRNSFSYEILTLNLFLGIWKGSTPLSAAISNTR